MYAIVDGEIGVEINGTHVQTFGPGQIVGEMGIIDPTHPPRTATVRALNDARLVPIDEEEFKRLVERVLFFALRGCSESSPNARVIPRSCC
jgi:CRP-like cAMP-binding protein